MINTLNLGRATKDTINKAVPQVQPMKVDEDLREFFQRFELTQLARRTPRETYASTLLPLLNPVCTRYALSLQSNQQLSYSTLKRVLLAKADTRSAATIQVFWEHRKPKKSTWGEELAELTKLIRRCTPGDDPETIRNTIVMEQLTQQLPRSIQLYVRERKPHDPDELLELISRIHKLDETDWEPKESYSTKKTAHKPTVTSSPKKEGAEHQQLRRVGSPRV